jgi:hypothetical protein
MPTTQKDARFGSTLCFSKQQHDKCKEHSIPCNIKIPVAHIQQVVEYAALDSLPDCGTIMFAAKFYMK